MSPIARAFLYLADPHVAVDALDWPASRGWRLAAGGVPDELANHLDFT